jgi:hypothetical protein
MMDKWQEQKSPKTKTKRRETKLIKLNWTVCN